MTTLVAAGLRLASGYGPDDAYLLAQAGCPMACDHRAGDATDRLDVECEGRIDPGETYVLVRHGFDLGKAVRLECLQAARVIDQPPPCGHRDVSTGCGGCDPGAIEYVLDDERPGVLRAPRPDDFMGGAR